MVDQRWPRLRYGRHPLWMRGLAFLAAVALIYLGSLYGTAHVDLQGFSLLARLTGHDLVPGGRFQSLRRFREADEVGRVDVVFLGSSHAYRGFDTRRFSIDGQTAFNLGSTNQTPLNARYLAERYLPEMRPRLLVVELYPHNLTHDGLESTRDLLVNTTFHPSQLRMAVATHQLDALHFSIAKSLGWTQELGGVEQRAIEGETYVPGGYCATQRSRLRLRGRGASLGVTLSERQRAHLIELTGLAKDCGATVVWVTHPLPEDHLRLVDGLAELRRSLHEAAGEAGAVYWDYNERLTLDPLADFMDFHHLNQRGVEQFNEALLGDLRREGFWPP